MNVDRSAAIEFACGAPGSGKSHYVKARLSKLRPPRLIVIDPDGEYSDGCGALHDRADELLEATAFAEFRARLRPSHVRSVAEAQFDAVCRIVRWHAAPEPGQVKPPRAGPVCLVVDELADLVGPSFRDTPESWQWIVRRGRKYGVTLLAASQRPAQIDKTLFSLCSTIRTGRLNDRRDQATVAAALGVQPAELAELAGHAWMARDKNTGKLTRGK